MKTLEDKISLYGKSLITNFYILVRITGIYDSMNETILNIANRFLSDLEHMLEETGEVTIKIISGSFYIEGVRVKAGVSDIESFTLLSDELKKKSIGLLDFRSPVRVDDLIHLAYAIKNGSEATDIQSALEGRLARGINIGGPVAVQTEEEIDLKDPRAMAKRAYLKSLSAFREMDNSIKSGKRFKLKKAKRALQLIVDCILTDESYLMGLANVKNYENYYYYHPVNVSILSVALGKRFDLAKVHLRTLAMAALFHDAGKIGIPFDILNKKADFTSKEYELIKRHPVDGVKVLLRSFGLNEASILSMLVSFEHHMKLDHSGYPSAAGSRSLNLFSRIISIADEYDCLVSGRVYDRKKLSPEGAIEAISRGSGTFYDPVFIKAFRGIFGQ